MNSIKNSIAKKELPILFSTPMIPPVLADTKTQTRRTRGLGRFNVAPDEWRYDGEQLAGLHAMVHVSTGKVVIVKSPYGAKGERLWVREAWLPARHGSYEPIPRGDTWLNLKSPWSCSISYRADYLFGFDEHEGHWRPSIHMPRWASRTNLKVLDVRIERLNDISEADAIAEGVSMDEAGWFFVKGLVHHGRLLKFRSARECYQHLWDSINGTGHWANNWWVWRDEFRRTMEAA